MRLVPGLPCGSICGGRRRRLDVAGERPLAGLGLIVLHTASFGKPGQTLQAASREGWPAAGMADCAWASQRRRAPLTWQRDLPILVTAGGVVTSAELLHSSSSNGRGAAGRGGGLGFGGDLAESSLPRCIMNRHLRNKPTTRDGPGLQNQDPIRDYRGSSGKSITQLSRGRGGWVVIRLQAGYTTCPNDTRLRG